MTEALKATKIGNADVVLLPELAGAQAAAGDFDGAFATVERLKKGIDQGTVGDALGKVAEEQRT